MASVKDQLFDYVHVQRGKPPHVKKVTIVGVGQVGMACAYSIMQQVCSFFALRFSGSFLLRTVVTHLGNLKSLCHWGNCFSVRAFAVSWHLSMWLRTN